MAMKPPDEKGLHGEGLEVRLNGHFLLQGVEFHLRPGEMLGLIGPNGAGKSTLLRLLAGLLPCATGRLRLDGEALDALAPENRARRVAYLAQNGPVHWPLPVERLVALGRLPHLPPWGRAAPRDREVIERVLADTDLLPLRRRPFDTLSGGERARALLARALAVEPEVLLADEPVAALDPAHQLEVMELLRRHCQGGGAVVVVLHDLPLAAHYCDRLQLLHRGAAVACDRPGAVLQADNLRRVYGLCPNASGDGWLDLPWRLAAASDPQGGLDPRSGC
jgi:iron complex transport system ATP-binding protein